MTDNISSQLTIVMDGKSISEQISSSQLHIEDRESGLKVYVPYEESLRDVCYLSDLPRRLVEWMMTDPVTRIPYDISSNMLVVTQAVLNAKSAVVERLLDDFGIIEAGLINRNFEEETYDSAPSPRSDLSRVTSLSPAASSQAQSSSSSTIVPVISNSRADSDFEEERLRQETPDVEPRYFHSQSSDRPWSPYSHYPAREDITADLITENYSERRRSAANEYRALLSQIIAAARRSRLLARTFDLSGLADSLAKDSFTHNQVFDEYSLFHIGLIPQMERDKMVGAAGELFVSCANACFNRDLS